MLTRRSSWTLATLAGCALLLGSLGGCGGGGKSAPPKRAAKKSDGMDAEGGKGKAGPAGKPGAPAAKGKAAAFKLSSIAKAPDPYHDRGFTKADWAEDITGDINRDPFRAYLPTAAKAPTGPEQAGVPDECAKRMVAPAFGIGEVRLVGIVQRGTKSYALFIDNKGLGHIVHRGDCLSRDKAQITDVAEDRVVGKIQPPPPPGQAAPPPVEKEWALHPKELQLTEIGPQ